MRFFAAFLVLSLLVVACLAPRPEDGEEGSAEELGRLVGDGATPVYGTTTEAPASAGEDGSDLPDPAAAAAILEEYVPLPLVEQNPYIRFGERIIVKKQEGQPTLITKPFPMPPGKAQRLVDLMQALEPFPFRQRPAPGPGGELPPYDPDLLEYQILKDWDQEYYANLVAEVPGPITGVTLSDVLVVTATPPLLGDFQAFLDLFSAGVPQIELEAKIIEVVETDRLDVGVKPVLVPGMGGDPDVKIPTFQFGGNNFVQGLTFDFENSSDPTEALLALGAVQSGFAFNALIEAVSTWQNVTIESRPKTVVRAGGVARLESTIDIPFFTVQAITSDGNFTTNLTYKRTGVKLYITPRVVGSNTLALDVQLENSQAVGVQNTLQVSGGADIQIPVIAYRTARTIVYLEPGQTLLIGGLTQENSQEILHKVPILGDIPLLGLLFRSTFTEKRREHVLFAISPRIIQRNDLNSEL